jgi:hypothetical protein
MEWEKLCRPAGWERDVFLQTAGRKPSPSKENDSDKIKEMN